jgi:hypothetical protein
VPARSSPAPCPHRPVRPGRLGVVRGACVRAACPPRAPTGCATRSRRRRAGSAPRTRWGSAAAAGWPPPALCRGRPGAVGRRPAWPGGAAARCVSP